MGFVYGGKYWPFVVVAWKVITLKFVGFVISVFLLGALTLQIRRSSVTVD